MGYKFKQNLLGYGSSIIKTAADTKVNERIVQPKPTIPQINYNFLNATVYKSIADLP